MALTFVVGLFLGILRDNQSSTSLDKIVPIAGYGKHGILCYDAAFVLVQLANLMQPSVTGIVGRFLKCGTL